MAWVFHGAGLDGNYNLFGGNIFGHNWVDTGQKADVVDPHFGARLKFTVWQVAAGNKTCRFAAGEFSNGVWGFYLPA